MKLPIKQLKIVLFIVCLLPFIQLVTYALIDELGANPIEEIIHETGIWTLRLLLLTLLITPLRKITGIAGLIKLRRMLGLYTFFYACWHFFSYLILDQFFDWMAIWEDVVERPYITIGFSAFLLLIPLAITSNNAMIKRLGGKNWQRLHQAVYFIAIAGVVHFWWLIKADIREPLLYAVLFTLLFILRHPRWRFNH